MEEHTTPSRVPIVLPSVDLDAHLHEQAADITKRRYSKNRYGACCNAYKCTLILYNSLDLLCSLPCSVKSTDVPSVKCSSHDNELMTPPDVLLEQGLDECTELAKSNTEVNILNPTSCDASPPTRCNHNHTHIIGST